MVLALEVHENTFAKEDYLMFVLAPTDGNVFTRETLAAVEELTEASWKVPLSSRINSLTTFQHIEADGDDLRIFPLVQDASSLSDDDIERIRDIALGSPELSGRLLSKDGAVTAVSAALPGKQGGDVETAVQIAVYARKLAASFEERHPHIDVHITGSVMFDAAFMEVPQREMQYLVPLMLLLLLAIVGVGLRSLWGTVGTLLVILMSVSAALGASVGRGRAQGRQRERDNHHSDVVGRKLRSRGLHHATRPTGRRQPAPGDFRLAANQHVADVRDECDHGNRFPVDEFLRRPAV